MPKSTSEYLLDCQNAVKDKRYVAALDALKSALQDAQKNGRGDHINILDHRVAVYLNMESLDLAHKDAKNMVRHDRKDGRGYLRCGQIERLLGNQAAAINWYKQGLKRVPTTHRSFSSLRKQVDKVESQVQQGLVFMKASDPLLAMPLETVELILSFLNFKQTVGLLRVSRSWNKLVSSLPPLIDTIDYRAPKRPINNSMLRATLRKLRVPKSITATQMCPEARQELIGKLQNGRSFTELSHLELLLDDYPAGGLPFSKYKLKSLVLGIAGVSKTSGLNINIVDDILIHCPKLEVLAVHDLRGVRLEMSPPRLLSPALHLRKLSIRTCGTPSYSISPFTLANMPNLMEISFEGVFLAPDSTESGGNNTDLRCMERLKTLRLNPECFASYHLCFPAKLQDLRIHYLKSVTWRPIPDVPPLTRLTDLRTLDLKVNEWPRYLDSEFLPTEEETNLSELSLDVDLTASRRGLEFLEHGCVKRLRHLTFGCQNLKDVHSTTFIERIPQLETLTLRDAAITGVFIMDLLKAPTCRLREIHLRACPNISRDVVPWAKARGVNITMRKNLESAKNGQRRVHEYY